MAQLIGQHEPRLVAETARLVGMCFLGASMLCIVLPGAVSPDMLVAVVPAYAAMVVCLVRGRSRSTPWMLTAVLAGWLAIALLGLPALGGATPSSASAVALLASAVIPSLVVGPVKGARALVVPSFALVVTVAVAIIATAPIASPTATVAQIAVGWAILTAVSLWLSASIRRAAARIVRLGHAHLAERQASETEGVRRHGARLLHDTVLATLTLLAHAGRGVGPEALRAQAAEDARLLRQLRLGGTPAPRASGAYTLEATETSDLGHTLESVRQRFDRMGLAVSWHGAGRILLPSDVLDAFLLSLAECLENVRRHSGVSDAEVTITQDDTTVRAMVTDTGVGFDLDGVDAKRLGLAESVIARIREVGGRTRLFSAPGSGTTVVLEVPK